MSVILLNRPHFVHCFPHILHLFLHPVFSTVSAKHSPSIPSVSPFLTLCRYLSSIQPLRLRLESYALVEKPQAVCCPLVVRLSEAGYFPNVHVRTRSDTFPAGKAGWRMCRCIARKPGISAAYMPPTGTRRWKPTLSYQPWAYDAHVSTISFLQHRLAAHHVFRIRGHDDVDKRMRASGRCHRSENGLHCYDMSESGFVVLFLLNSLIVSGEAAERVDGHFFHGIKPTRPQLDVGVTDLIGHGGTRPIPERLLMVTTEDFW